MPIQKGKTSFLPKLDERPIDQKRREACERLGVTQEAIAASPKITQWLRKLPGGMKTAWDCLRTSESSEAQQVLKFHDSLPPTVSERLPIEAYCLAAGISPLRLLAVITEAAATVSVYMGNMMAALDHSSIVQTNLDSAKNLAGVKDREMHFKHMNYLPVPKGSQINIVNLAQAKGSDEIVSLPSPEDTIRELNQRFNEELPPAEEVKSLPMPSVPVTEVEYIESDK